MKAVCRRLLLYVTTGGSAPFVEWIESLRDIQARGLIRARLDRVQLGNLGDCRPLGEGLHELRIEFGPGYRVYFVHLSADSILLLCGGLKRGQNADIARARRYWQDYRSRHDA